MVSVSQRSSDDWGGNMDWSGHMDGSRHLNVRVSVSVDWFGVVRLRNGNWVRNRLVDGFVHLLSSFRLDVGVLGRQLAHL